MLAGHRPICVDELYSEISTALSEQTREIEESMKVAADKVTKQLLQDIKEDAPVRTGGYKKGWKRKKLKYSYVVYQSKKAGLTHILEYGRVSKTTGKRIGIKPHIKVNEERSVNEYEDLCVAIVSEGLRLK